MKRKTMMVLSAQSSHQKIIATDWNKPSVHSEAAKGTSFTPL
jgi:hypothetical protein